MGISEAFLVDKGFRFINPTACGFEKCRSGHFYGPTARDYWLLHYIISGKGYFRLEGKEYFLGAGQCFIIRPFEETYYSADCDDPWEYIWIGFISSIELPALFYDTDVFDANGQRDVFFSFKEMINAENYREELVYGKIFELLARVSDNSGSQTASDQIAAKAKRMIETKYSQNLTVSDIASGLHLERTYFSAAFKRSVGVSPQKYLLNYRLSVAATLLSDYDYAPGQAAIAVGYTDPLNFSRMFKRRYGISPAKFKNAN